MAGNLQRELPTSSGISATSSAAPCKRNEYRKVILPLTVLRGLDATLEPTKTAVLKEFDGLKGKSEPIVMARLKEVSGVPFYNLSRMTFKLSEIIRVLNDKLGTEFTDEDRLFFEQIQEKAIRDERVIQIRQANPPEKFALGIKEIIEALMMQRMSENDAIVTRYMDDAEFQKTVFPILAKNIYQSIISPQESSHADL